MSIPVLRRPKRVEDIKNNLNNNRNDYMILTLKDGKKLVVSSDSYHGIVSTSDICKCIICNNEFESRYDFKESHKRSSHHKKLLSMFPHREEFAENLIRQLDNKRSYCTICNVSILTRTLTRHIVTDSHTEELKKAIIKSFTYQPMDLQNVF